jgi:hypothetical protein
MSVMKSLLIRATCLLWLAALAACGHGSKGPTTVGVGVGVALTVPAGTTIVAQGATAEIDATVSNDANNAGVTWTITPACVPTTACTSTNSKFNFTAPSGVVGARFATLTAASITDPTKFASVTLTINGTPTILQPVLFPANENVAYTTYISAAGGTAPYTWTLSTGTLPAGLTLSGSTAATTAITGTPTALGSSTFTLALKDAAGLTTSITLTLTVAPQTACLLSGPFAYLATGFYNGAAVTRAGSVTVTTTGTITGVHDYSDGTHLRPASAVTSGTCQTLTQNRGQLHISSSASGNESFDFATDATLKKGHLQQDDGTGVIEAGELYFQDSTAFNLATLAGDWAFGGVGDDGGRHRFAVVGRLTLDAGGVVSAGSADSHAAAPAVAAAVTGTLAAPDANGRGTTTLTVGSLALPLAYYVVDANTLLLVSNGTQGGAPRIAGRMTRQSGAGALDSTAFSGASILSLWGSSFVGSVPSATVTAGRLSASTASAGTAAATLGVEFDVADRGTQSANFIFAAQPYTVAANGRTTLAIGSGATLRNFVVYADGAGGGYVLEPASAVGNFGILDLQAPGPYSDFTTAYYVGGTMFPGSTSPVTLAPQLLFQSGSVGGNLTGNYALDPATGRMVAAVSRTILGGSDLVIYIVSPTKLVIMGDNLNITNAQLAWFRAY